MRGCRLCNPNYLQRLKSWLGKTFVRRLNCRAGNGNEIHNERHEAVDEMQHGVPLSLTTAMVVEAHAPGALDCVPMQFQVLRGWLFVK
ncbi:MAG: hypothetical protein RMJ54_04240 [Roseiflexaceae bacterium]|nr:hypothetical protein [Roseiflexus sp.]MDW8231969.1 hypothetical protein [Roseiflexaceae bacterium]